MRDIVERLELQAFVADKIQSGMKPLIMDCLEEITHLRCQYEALHNQAEMNARLLTENASLRAENLKLRNEVMSDYHEGWEEGVKAERERCAKIAERYLSNNEPVRLTASSIAAAIRDSGE